MSLPPHNTQRLDFLGSRLEKQLAARVVKQNTDTREGEVVPRCQNRDENCGNHSGIPDRTSPQNGPRRSLAVRFQNGIPVHFELFSNFVQGSSSFRRAEKLV
jgi:hypothetical protein